MLIMSVSSKSGISLLLMHSACINVPRHAERKSFTKMPWLCPAILVKVAFRRVHVHKMPKALLKTQPDNRQPAPRIFS